MYFCFLFFVHSYAIKNLLAKFWPVTIVTSEIARAVFGHYFEERFACV